MNGLYKRYIPPKATTAPVSATSATATPTKAHPAAFSPAVESAKKRKRERSADEVAERKAKKLRKKGTTTTSNVVSAVKPAAQPTEDEDKAANAAAEARGDFSHITNAKKRHKLEKEARKAGLRVAGKIGKPEVAPEAPVLETMREEAAITEAEDGMVAEENPETEQAGPEASGMEQVEQPSDPAPKLSKKRRHKLENVLAGGVESATDLESEKKHNTVLDKFKKSAKRSPVPEEREASKTALETVHHLEIPDAEMEDFVPDRDSELPEWLREPQLVDSKSEKKSWSALQLDPSTCDRLNKLTFSSAMPIQQALVPLLLPPGIPGAMYLPGSERVLPDLVVSAPTGSGKTVSYLLPITEGLRNPSTTSATEGRLEAVIIVPTQELVAQTAAVAEALSKGSKIRVGQSNNKHSIRDEQKKLVKRGMQYDPVEYKRIMDIANLGQPRNCPMDTRSPEYAAWLEASVPEPKTAQQIEILSEPSWPQGFIPTYHSLVDIFVTTPQRLQDHIEESEGFALDHLTWLVLDEADKMLDNQHRSFLETLHQATDRELHVYRDYSGKVPLAYQPPRLRKVVCSATIPSDVKVEYAFKLLFPKLVAERAAEREAHADSGADAYARRADASGEARGAGELMELPRKLVEYTVPVGDGSEKPLVAIELLKSRMLNGIDMTVAASSTKRATKADPRSDSSSDSSSESDSDSDSDISSITSSEDSDSSSDDDSPAPLRKTSRDKNPKLSHKHNSLDKTSEASAPTILIFTASTESANRLTHLIKSLVPTWSPFLTTILKGQPRRTTLRASDPAIIISTDRAGRGLDGFHGRMFTHVIQYDVPRSLTDYIHRVGRTARAGRAGEAWTLVTHKQAGWFKEEVIKSHAVGRERVVEEVKLARASEEVREAYQVALASMREELEGGQRAQK
ncbi:Putative ATP-dependent RNA helicase DEAD-box, Helicase superfamily 1/2, ATP-binding protein [Septoria linicola]|uniref:ATP-dependent RNA helicase n=1 Tax=Septoria linicola TaxID=215465 RepID=A0A9Q9ALJ9_9PEZI|nr:Putative ATP-dependent RNA helicase DEAD-box, Helicase superfamily 1/2, ATP-binding protein [Septoria linicola]